MKIKIQNYNQNNNLLFNLIFCFFPVSFILGNFAVNLNIFILILLTLIFNLKTNAHFFIDTFDKLLIFLFLYILFVGVLNFIEIYLGKYELINFKNAEWYIISKSFFYIRYLFLYFSIKFLVQNKIINFKYFFLTTTLLVFFVAFDILIQFIFGKDIFGYTTVSIRALSGPFGSELIAGSYLQRFFPFLFFFIFYFSQFKKKLLLVTISIFLILFAIVLSGNRMPFIMSIFAIFLIFLSEKKIRKYLITIFIFCLLIFSFTYFFNKGVKDNYNAFYGQIKKMASIFVEKKIDRKNMPYYFHEFESFYDTWQINKYFGGSVRSFRIFCPIRENIDVDERSTCNTHPHNYYLEIISELGIFGLLLILSVMFLLLKISLLKILNDNFKNSKILMIPFFILLITEIFPIKNTGSFFSTWNSAYIFILIGCLSGLNLKEYIKFNKQIGV